MEHAKKMFLINPESWQKMQDSGDITNPQTLSQLDIEMKEILKSKIKDYEKWSKYQQVLQRFLHFSNAAREPIKVPLLEEEKFEESHHVSPPQNEGLSAKEIIETVPKNMKNKSSLLLQHISKSDYIKWDRNGLVHVNNQVLKDSNIIDIVNDIVRNRKPRDIKNKDIILQSLKHINTPMEFIQNKLYLDYFIKYNIPNNLIRESSSSDTDYMKSPISLTKPQKNSSKALKSKQEQSDENTPTKRKKKRPISLLEKIGWESF